MGISGIVLLAAIIVILVYFIVIYNNLVKYRLWATSHLVIFFVAGMAALTMI